jgi:hypothetical protein
VNGVTDQDQVGLRSGVERSLRAEEDSSSFDGGTLNHFDKRNGTPSNENVM